MHKDEIEKYNFFPQELINKMAAVSDGLAEEKFDTHTAIDELVTCCQFLAKRVRELEEAAAK